MCVYSNKGSTLYTTPPPRCVFFLNLKCSSQCCCVGGETHPTTAEGCPTREWLTVIIGDKVTGWVSQCAMKANLCTLGCRRFVSWLPLRWLLWWKCFLAVWQCFLSQRSQAVMLTTFCSTIVLLWLSFKNALFSEWVLNYCTNAFFKLN